jgi:hypothetical protein
MKNDKQSSEISRVSLDAHLSNLANNAGEDQYSILKNARRDENELAEIASALGTKYIRDVVTFSPRRMAFHETIVTIGTEAKLRNQNDLEKIVTNVYSKHVVPLLKSKPHDSDQKIETILLKIVDQNIQEKLERSYKLFKQTDLNQQATNNPVVSKAEQSYLEEIKKVHNILQSRIDKGLYSPGEINPGENLESITKKIAFDKFYKQEMSEQVKKIIKPKIMEQLDSKVLVYPNLGLENDNRPIEKLSLHKGNKRHTFMMTGAPASGKSTLLGIAAVDAETNGIDFSDICKVNTDHYRNLVANEKELGPNKTLHSTFSCDETLLITQRFYDCLKEKVLSKEGAPHLLIDTVYPHQHKIDFSVMNEGQLHLNCVTVPTEISVKRALDRGETSGRYVDTDFIIKSNREISRDFHDILDRNKGRNIDYKLVDNNITPGDLPIIFEAGNLKTGESAIYNSTSLMQFTKKANENQATQSKDNFSSKMKHILEKKSCINNTIPQNIGRKPVNNQIIIR